MRNAKTPIGTADIGAEDRGVQLAVSRLHKYYIGLVMV
jgi:hypothetical protein